MYLSPFCTTMNDNHLAAGLAFVSCAGRPRLLCKARKNITGSARRMYSIAHSATVSCATTECAHKRFSPQMRLGNLYERVCLYLSQKKILTKFYWGKPVLM